MWMVGLVGLVAVTLFALSKGFEYRNASAQRALEQAHRAHRKIHLGDDAKTVRLRLGIPDTVLLDDGKTAVWLYRIASAGSDSINAVILDKSAGAQIVDRIYMGGSAFWVPEDGLMPTAFTDADEALEAFKRVLGAPCRMSYDSDSTSVFYWFPLSGDELKHDSVYRRMTAKADARFPFRFLRIGLRNGKKVTDHGWTVSKSGHAACSPSVR